MKIKSLSQFARLNIWHTENQPSEVLSLNNNLRKVNKGKKGHAFRANLTDLIVKK